MLNNRGQEMNKAPKVLSSIVTCVNKRDGTF